MTIGTGIAIAAFVLAFTWLVIVIIKDNNIG